MDEGWTQAFELVHWVGRVTGWLEIAVWFGVLFLVKHRTARGLLALALAIRVVMMALSEFIDSKTAASYVAVQLTYYIAGFVGWMLALAAVVLASRAWWNERQRSSQTPYTPQPQPPQWPGPQGPYGR